MQEFVIRFVSVMLAISCGSVAAAERYWPGLESGTVTTFTSGLEYIEGDYGTADNTELLRIPFIYSQRRGQYAFSAESALLFAESNGNIVIDDKMSSRHSPSGPGAQSASGVGDVWLSVSRYLAPAEALDQNYRITARVKLATASESDGLGTGETDVALEAAMTRLNHKYTLDLMLGYEINGDSPVYNYDDYLYGRIGLSTPLADKRIVGASVYLAESAAAGGEEPLEITGYYRQPASHMVKASELYLYVTLGLTDGSPDSALGALLQFRL